MITLEFADIFSMFHNKIDAYDFLELTNEEINMFETEWLKTAGSKVYVRRLFSTYQFDADSEVINFEMRYATDDGADTDFVIEILAIGMCVEWLSPKVNSLTGIYQTYGSKEEKLRALLMVRYIRKRYSVFLRVCWDALIAVIPKRKDEKCLYGNGFKSLQIG